MDLNFKRRSLFLLLLVVAGGLSCQKNINLEIPDIGTKLVVNTVLIADSPMVVNVTNSVKALSNSLPLNIGNATVTLKGSDGTETLLNYSGDGNYKSSVLAKSGINYTLNVACPNYPSVNANFAVPDNVMPDTAWCKLVVGAKDANEKFEFKLKDKAGTANYYAVTLAQIDSAGGVYQIWLTPGSDNPADFSNSEGYLNGNYYFSDDLMDGKEIEKSFYYFSNSIYDSTGVPVDLQRLLLFKSISKEYFLYKITQSKQIENSNNPFSEPVNIYGNINQGYGIAGAYSQSIKVIPLLK